jgi:Phospholipase B
VCLCRLLQISGDIEDLESALKGGRRMRDVGNGHCSALVKLLPGNSDLYTSQVTWTSYGQMLRTLKKYSFGYHLTPGGPSFLESSR